MALYIPDGVRIYESSEDNLVDAALHANAVITAAGVTAQGVPNMTVNVAAGTAAQAGGIVAIGANAALAMSPADPAQPRIDLVVYDKTTGVVSAISGTPAPTPKPPALPTTKGLLAFVSVSAAALNIGSSNITDMRIQSWPVLIAGLLTNRPTATVMSGGTYFATDAGLFRSNGTTWASVAIAPAAFPDGTAAAPSVSFINDTDTGYYRSGSNQSAIVGGGANVARFVASASPVNWVDINSAATGIGPSIQAVGSDANVALTISSKGGGNVLIAAAAAAHNLLNLVDAASAVNYAQIAASPTGNSVNFQVAGTDTDVYLAMSSKGAGDISLYSGTFSRRTGQFINLASSVNYVIFQPSVTGNAISTYPGGTDTNVAYIISSKGNGSVFLMAGQNARTIAAFIDTASAVNNIYVQPNVTTGAAVIGAQGSDANVGVDIYSKGVGAYRFVRNGAAISFLIQDAASSVNYLQAGASAAGVQPSLSSAGTDTNIHIYLTPKGTGVVGFNYAATALGGGAAATLGTIGGTGPTVAGQTEWVKIVVNGNTRWFPVWL